MRVFVTGATGFIGSAVVRELIAAGHQVVGLARSDKAVEALTVAGAMVHRGSLEDLDSLRSAAASADGVIHLASSHDAGDFATSVAVGRRAVQEMGAALEGSQRPFVITSGTLPLAMLIGQGNLATEEIAPPPGIETTVPLLAAETAVTALAERGVRASLIRLSPSVHGADDHGFVPALIQIAQAKGVAAYVGDGANRWPAVHRLDAARLYRLALEKATAGSRWHGVADEGVPFRDIAGVIGRHLNLPVVSIPREEADAHFGWIGAFVAMDNPASSALTKRLLGWQPEQPDLIADLDEGHYFNG